MTLNSPVHEPGPDGPWASETDRWSLRATVAYVAAYNAVSWSLAGLLLAAAAAAAL